MARGLAAGLLTLELKRKQVVGIVLPTIPEFASVLYGIWDAGGICSPINPSYTSGTESLVLIMKGHRNNTIRNGSPCRFG
jgi:acyl-CoA synthetase (AMP-forming)/AMP-acid ligase II